MSLDSYYDSVRNYGSSADRMNDYLQSYAQEPVQQSLALADSIRAQGSSLVEAGGAVEGIYAGTKGLQSAVSSLKAKVSGSDAADAGDAGADAGDLSGEGGIALTDLASGTEAAAETGAIVSSTIGAGVEAGTGLLLGTAAVAAEAVPVIGGIAAIGIGLYELFHHHHTSKPASISVASNTMSSESIVPSFDSVTDAPAVNSAF